MLSYNLFKRFQSRLMCFFEEPDKLGEARRVVLTHGFKKKSDRTPPQEIERAVRLRDAYLAEEDQET